MTAFRWDRLRLAFGVNLLVCLGIPWAAHSAAGLRLNVIDLGEWMSLHPSVVGQQPPLATALLARASLLAPIFMIAFAAPRRKRWLIPLALVNAAALLPPVEAVRQLDNPNYRQLFLLAGLGAASGLLALFPLSARVRHLLLISLLPCVLVASLVGVHSGIGLMQGFGLQASVSGVAWVYWLTIAAAIVVEGVRAAKQNRRSTMLHPLVTTASA